jgi:lipid A 4'-phosphatase
MQGSEVPDITTRAQPGCAGARSTCQTDETHWKFWLCAAVLPALALTMVSLVIRTLQLDLAVARAFYAPEAAYPWPGLASGFCRLLYSYGPLPGIALGVVAVSAWILAARRDAFSTSTRIAGFTSVLLLIAPGLIVNLGLKSYWGRPRPSQVEHFGGEYAYAPLGETGDGPGNGSFPSGHASIAFFLMAPGFLFMRRRQKLAAVFLGSGLVAGVVMGIVRIAQGAHFLSDVIWAGAIVYFTGLILAALLKVNAIDTSDVAALFAIVRDDAARMLGLKRQPPEPPAQQDAEDAPGPTHERLAA